MNISVSSNHKEFLADLITCYRFLSNISQEYKKSKETGTLQISCKSFWFLNQLFYQHSSLSKVLIYTELGTILTLYLKNLGHITQLLRFRSFVVRARSAAAELARSVCLCRLLVLVLEYRVDLILWIKTNGQNNAKKCSSDLRVLRGRGPKPIDGESKQSTDSKVTASGRGWTLEVSWPPSGCLDETRRKEAICI